jgi:ABC-type dipeptide/oligopeptide/nickel transport system permease component
MLGFLAARLARVMIVVLGALTIVFIIVRLSGDPVALLTPQGATAQDVAQIRHQLGLDQPLPVQYVIYLRNLLVGDWGQSIKDHQPVVTLILDRLPATLELAAVAFLFVVGIALPLGILAARARGTWVDYLAMGLAALGQSVAPFWFGLILVLFFSLRLHWLPTSGTGTWQHVIMPALTFGIGVIASIARVTRAAMLDVLRCDYVRTARAKGLTERVLLARHAFRNAAIPVVTVVGLQAGTLLAGAVIAEQVFAWPGIGRLAIEAVNSRDYAVVQGVVIVFALMFSLVNIGIDLLYAVLDPRIRVGGKAWS